MKKYFLTFFIGLMMLLSLSSCEVYSYATTQDDIYVEAQADIVQSNIDFNIIVQYGTPYYHNGTLLYYIYRDLYYYPFYYDNYWYVRAYRRPFNHLHYKPYFRPHRYDYRLDRNYRPQHNWYRPNIRHSYTRPSTPQRTQQNNRINRNTRPTIPNSHRIDSHQGNKQSRGNFGGRR